MYFCEEIPQFVHLKFSASQFEWMASGSGIVREM